MQNNNENVNENVVEDNQDFDVIEEINNIKKNSVPLEKYKQLEEEHNKTLKAIIDGDVSGLELPENHNVKNEDNVKVIKELRNELATKELNNLEYVSKSLQLRNAVIDEFGEDKDPFLPFGHDVVVEQKDIDTANKVANTLQDLVDRANGDSQYFTNELSRVMVDVKIPGKR